MNGSNDSIGVLMLTKTGKVTKNERSARQYFVRVIDENGVVYRGKKDHRCLHSAIVQGAKILRHEGRPSTWDSEIFEDHYIRLG